VIGSWYSNANSVSFSKAEGDLVPRKVALSHEAGIIREHAAYAPVHKSSSLVWLTYGIGSGEVLEISISERRSKLAMGSSASAEPDRSGLEHSG
jgi:hypothetical protein